MGVYTTIFLYALTSSVFFPVFQSLIFYKACIKLSNSTEPEIACKSKETYARDNSVHSMSSVILMASSTGLCVSAFFTSRWVGHLSDVKSRKLAFLIPFIGLFISDFTILVQVLYPRLSPYYFIVSEVIYGFFGGYMSITSGAFSIVSTMHSDQRERAKGIARLEGTISLGSTVGFLISSQLKNFGYLGAASFFLVAHFIAFMSAVFMRDPERPDLQEKCVKRKPFCHGTDLLKDKKPPTSSNLKILYFSFACSYFAFIGSTRILFFYLKHRFYWGAEEFGYLKAMNTGMTTVMSLALYPFLKNLGITDIRLAIFGLLTRSIGRAWYAVAWEGWTVFIVVFFEMFSKFPATAMRSSIATNVGEHERGLAFSLVAVIEALCNLTSSWVFHLAWPLSLNVFPQLSFVIMPIIILPAITLMILNMRSLEAPELNPEDLTNSIEKSNDISENVNVHDPEALPVLHHIPTETDTLTDSTSA